MYCVDTSVIVGLMRGNVKLQKRISFLFNLDFDFGICYPVLCELYKGVYLSKNPRENLEKVRKVMRFFDCILEVNELTCKHFGQLHASQLKKGRPLQQNDELIASIAIMNDATLITMDKGFKNIEGLKVEVW